MLKVSTEFEADLKKKMSDDTQVVGNITEESWMYAKLEEFKMKGTQEYWNQLCNGTNMENNTLPGDVPGVNVTELLANWTVYNDSTCLNFHPLIYSDRTQALADCGRTCSGFIIMKTNGTTEYQLCEKRESPFAKTFKKQANGTTVIWKPEDYNEPKALPRPPIHLKYWENFCKYRLWGRTLRILHEGKTCKDAASLKVLANAANPVDCGRFAEKDVACAKPKVFDFKFGPPARCRCVLVTKSCESEVATEGDIWTETLQDKPTPAPNSSSFLAKLAVAHIHP